jgi:hypothetical protein
MKDPITKFVPPPPSEFEAQLETEQEQAEIPLQPKVRFLKPSECASYQIPKGHLLVGDQHIVRGEIFVIGGTQGVGKSRAVTYLAACGASKNDWFGRTIHHQFRTLIIQNENGILRLKDELQAVQSETDLDLDDWLRVTSPPDEGLRFSDPDFKKEICDEIERFAPSVIAIDPWNAVAGDDQQKDYLKAFSDILSACPSGDKKPAIGIVAHLRKPNLNDRRGRDGMHRLAGSYALASRPRCVFIMDPASNDETDDRVVWSCPKNNNGKLGERSAWYRTNGLFKPCSDFDWDTYDSDGHSKVGRKPKATLEDYAALLPPKGLTNTEWLQLAVRQLGVSKATFNRNLRECLCEPNPIVHKSKVTGKYHPIRRDQDKLVSKVSLP